MDHLSRAREVFAIELAAVEAVRDQLDDAFNRAVEFLAHTVQHRGKIVVAGVGKSGHIGSKVAATLTSTGAPSVTMNIVDALHGDLGVVSDGDTILAFSYSGETDELLNLLPALRRFAVRLIAVTASPRSTLGRQCDAVLRVRVPKEACPFNLAPTSSTTAMLVLGDALAMALLQARGFRQQDFARYHPSGAIGRALLLRAHDIMRTGDRNPVVANTVSVKEALLVMTRAKAGSVSVTNARGRLVGVFTDGDFRRHVARDGHVLDRSIAQVMTRHPVCVRDEALAMEALRIFNERQIDDLIVVNQRREPIGLIDLQDLPKMKLM